jgi:hypothetical protein
MQIWWPKLDVIQWWASINNWMCWILTVHSCRMGRTAFLSVMILGEQTYASTADTLLWNFCCIHHRRILEAQHISAYC